VPDTPITDSAAWLDCTVFEQRMMYLDLVTYLPDDILVKIDRAAMGVSL
jgi:asparagine synthase (glutamine-hydrolysing)